MILERISQETGISEVAIMKIVTTANYRYKTYRIKKRTGGHRIIYHPTPDLKFLQRWLNRNILRTLPVHDKAVAYRKGVGISDNAQLHVKNHYLLKIDFSNFFPSLKGNDVRFIIEKNSREGMEIVTEVDIDIILHTVCKWGALTIGAPSSPVLSNAILYDFDCYVDELCQNNNVTYSRYADDLFLSTDRPNILNSILSNIRLDLRDRISPCLTINENKTVFTSRKRKKVMTGLVLTTEGKVSIGRDKKRSVRTLIHLYSRGMLPADQISYLRGYLAFVNSVDPDFLARLRQKYCDSTIDELLTIKPAIRKTYGKER